MYMWKSLQIMLLFFTWQLCNAMCWLCIKILTKYIDVCDFNVIKRKKKVKKVLEPWALEQGSITIWIYGPYRAELALVRFCGENKRESWNSPEKAKWDKNAWCEDVRTRPLSLSLYLCLSGLIPSFSSVYFFNLFRLIFLPLSITHSLLQKEHLLACSYPILITIHFKELEVRSSKESLVSV